MIELEKVRKVVVLTYTRYYAGIFLEGLRIYIHEKPKSGWSVAVEI
jgi:hypothetical protein